MLCDKLAKPKLLKHISQLHMGSTFAFGEAWSKLDVLSGSPAKRSCAVEDDHSSWYLPVNELKTESHWVRTLFAWGYAFSWQDQAAWIREKPTNSVEKLLVEKADASLCQRSHESHLPSRLSVDHGGEAISRLSKHPAGEGRFFCHTNLERS